MQETIRLFHHVAGFHNMYGTRSRFLGVFHVIMIVSKSKFWNSLLFAILAFEDDFMVVIQ